MGIYEYMDTSESYEVQGATFTEGRGHPPTELARVVASQAEWRLAYSCELLDEHLQPIARTINEAALAMDRMGWFIRFSGDNTGINWGDMPNHPADQADAIREWLKQNRPSGLTYHHPWPDWSVWQSWGTSYDD